MGGWSAHFVRGGEHEKLPDAKTTQSMDIPTPKGKFSCPGNQKISLDVIKSELKLNGNLARTRFDEQFPISARYQVCYQVAGGFVRAFQFLGGFSSTFPLRIFRHIGLERKAPDDASWDLF